MKRFIVVASVVTALFVGNFRISKTNPTFDASSLIAQIGSAKVLAAYKAWVSGHEAQGGDQNIVLRLGPIKWLSSESTSASGVAHIDLTAGDVEVEVIGLPSNQNFDVWLIDNYTAPGHTAGPDPGDGMINLGTLRYADGILQVKRSLGSNTFQQFIVDLVAVAPTGSVPSDSALIFGSTPLFQRMYTSLRNPRLFAWSDFRSDETALLQENELFSWFGAGESHAKGSGSSNNLDIDPLDVDPDAVLSSLVRNGADLFMNETFDGNGRTCATCHPASNNFTIDPAFIAELPDDDPLFVAEFIPALANNFEKPLLMRNSALILENIDGTDDLANNFVMRSVPHTLALSTSITGPNFPYDNTAHPNPVYGIIPPAERTGWGGDGASGTGSLRDFAMGAVMQHFPLRTDRILGVDFRLPTESELDALEAFQLSLGRSAEIDITPGSPTELVFTDPVVEHGKILFSRVDSSQGAAGKCIICHNNAGANVNGAIIAAVLSLVGVQHSNNTVFDPNNPVHVADVEGNGNFGTGVNDLGAIPADLIDPINHRRDGGFGRVSHTNRLGANCGGIEGGLPRTGFGTVTAPGSLLHTLGAPEKNGLCEEDFNTPPLVEAADTPPFFHNNAVATIEAAVAFYNDDAFNNQAGGRLLAAGDTNGIGIRLDTSEVSAIASLLRVINALENIRSAKEMAVAHNTLTGVGNLAIGLIDQAIEETEDAESVLEQGGLHQTSVDRLDEAAEIFKTALEEDETSSRINTVNAAVSLLESARNDMVVSP